MANSPDDLDDDRTDELPVLLETVVLDSADPRLPSRPAVTVEGMGESVEDTAEHTARYPAFAAVEGAELEDLRSDLEARGAKIAALEGDIARLTSRWSDVETHLSTKDSEIAALKRIVDDVGATAAEHRAGEERLRVALAAREAETARLANELATLRQAAAETTTDRGAAAAELAAARSSGSAARAEAEAARAEHAAAAEAARAAAAEAAALRAAAATQQVERARQESLKVESASLEQSRRIVALEREIQAGQTALRRAETIAASEIERAKAARAELVTKAREVESLRRELAERRAAEAAPSHEGAALRSALAAARADADKAAAELARANEARNADAHRLGADKARLESELAALQRQTAVDAAPEAPPLAAFEVIAQLESEVEFKRQQVNAQLVALQERDRRLADLEAAAARSRDELAALRADLDKQRADAARLERALVDRDRAVEAKDARIAALQDELNQKLGAIQRLNAMDLSLQGLDSRMSERLRQSDKVPVDNVNTPALVCLTGDAPKQFALTKPAIVIGRGAHCDVQILTHFVSREHARISVTRGTAVIEDLGSTNGVFVNSVRVDRQELRQGDLITVGETQFRFLESMAH